MSRAGQAPVLKVKLSWFDAGQESGQTYSDNPPCSRECLPGTNEQCMMRLSSRQVTTLLTCMVMLVEQSSNSGINIPKKKLVR